MELILYNAYFLDLLKLMQSCLQMGKDIPQELIDEAKHYGRLAEVPEEQLNLLEVVNDHGATIH